MTVTQTVSHKSAERNIWLDILKGFAILAVVFYHLGVLPYGYLGVDLFLVINGYLITKSLEHSSISEKPFSAYVSFMVKRVSRLWLPVLLAAAVSIGIGLFTMLPDDLENLGYSVVASNCFLNNVLACITTKNYWDVVNNYKPLMHTWYLGVIVQCYVVLPFFFIVPRRIFKNSERSARCIRICFWVITLISCLLYLVPCATTAQKFYYIPFRFFEIGAGALAALYLPQIKLKQWRNHAWLFAVLLLALFVLPLSFLPSVFKLLPVAAAGVGCLFYSGMQPTESMLALSIRKILSSLGMASYSIFVWHQVVFALYRYVVRAVFTAADYVLVLAITAVLSLLSYLLLEQRLLKSRKHSTVVVKWIVTVLLFVVTTGAGLQLYRIGGVVRDVPELNISIKEQTKGMHAAYNDRVYQMDGDFLDDDRCKVLVIGNSFGRDWVNVLLESSYQNKLDISYESSFSDDAALTKRIQTADYIFWVGIPTEEQADVLQQYMKPSTRLLGVGTKNFGECNGNIYNRRHEADYFTLRTAVMPSVLETYYEETAYWGNDYVDFLAPVLDANHTVPVFSKANRFISQDCRHLTQSGAQFYAEILDLDTIFMNGD